MVCCLKPGGRRPVALRQPIGMYDVQGAVPAGWCSRCGKEVYKPRQPLCYQCEEEEILCARNSITRTPAPA